MSDEAVQPAEEATQAPLIETPEAYAAPRAEEDSPSESQKPERATIAKCQMDRSRCIM